MEWWSMLLSMVGLIIALLLVTSIVYFSWRNGIPPLPASPLLLGEVEREVREAIQRIRIVHGEPQAGQRSVEVVNGLIASAGTRVESTASSIQQGQQRAWADTTQAMLDDCPPLKLVEAGSGWGTLAMHLKRHFPALHVTGIENSPVPYLASRGLAWLRRSEIALIRGDLYQYDYRDTDLIVCYLFPGAMQRLGELWREQCRQDAYIISVYFALPGWEPEHMITCRDIHRTRIYIYRAGHRSYVV